MTRALFGFACVLVLGTLFPAQAWITGPSSEAFELTSELCGSKSHQAVYRGNDFSGAVMYQATVVEPANSILIVSPCISNETFTVIDGSDPSTFLIRVPTQCAQFWVAKNATSTDCEKVTVEILTMTPASYCESEWTKNSTSENTLRFCGYPPPPPTPTPSSAKVLSMTAAATTAAFVASLAAF